MDGLPEQRLRKRIQRIEARLATLESEVLGPETPPDPVPVLPPPLPTRTAAPARREPSPARTPPPRAEARPRPPAPAPPRTAGELERAFGVAVLGRIGVAAVLLAAAYFAKLTWGQMSQVVRVVSIYALGGAFIGAGFLLRGRVAKKYVALLWGGGTAAVYTTT